MNLTNHKKGIRHWAWQKNPTNNAVHLRLKRKFGLARKYKCTDCGKQAKDWSFDRKKGHSSNLKRYKPRCNSCHMKLDMTKEKIEKRRKRMLGKKYSLGHKHTKETKIKMSLSHTGRKKSKKTIENMRLAAIKRWKNEN